MCVCISRTVGLNRGLNRGSKHSSAEGLPRRPDCRDGHKVQERWMKCRVFLAPDPLSQGAPRIAT